MIPTSLKALREIMEVVLYRKRVIDDWYSIIYKLLYLNIPSWKAILPTAKISSIISCSKFILLITKVILGSKKLPCLGILEDKNVSKKDITSKGNVERKREALGHDEKYDYSLSHLDPWYMMWGKSLTYFSSLWLLFIYLQVFITSFEGFENMAGLAFKGGTLPNLHIYDYDLNI